MSKQRFYDCKYNEKDGKGLACFPNILSVSVVLVKLIESAVYCYYKMNLDFLWVDQWCNKQ